MTSATVKIDVRGRISLAKLPGVQVGAYYIMRTEDDGRIILEPAVVVNSVTKQIIG